MLDIKFIKENKDIVKTAAEKKHIKIDIDRLIEIDNKRRKTVTEFEKKKAEQNAASEQIARITDESERKHLIIKMKMLKEVIAGNEAELKEIITEWRYLMARVPNIPDMSVPEGIINLVASGKIQLETIKHRCHYCGHIGKEDPDFCDHNQSSTVLD